MKKWMNKTINYKRKLAGILLLGCSTLLYGAEGRLQSAMTGTEKGFYLKTDQSLLDLEKGLQEAVVFPVAYQHKVYKGGEYIPVLENYKIDFKNDTLYVPLRLMAYFMSNDTEFWDVRWDAAKPNEITLVCSYMQKISENGGWINTGATQSTIKLTIGSKKIIMNQQEVTLSTAPEKIDGRIVLPLRALSEAISKQLTYKDGLIFLSEEPLELQLAGAQPILKEMKTRLENSNKPLEYQSLPTATQNVQGQTYYVMYDNDGNTQSATGKLYGQKVGQGAVLIKEIPNMRFLEQPFVGDNFYYMKTDQDQGKLYALDLNTKEERLLGEISSKETDFSWVGKVIAQDNQVYITVHYGDWTMGSETLYCFENGKAEKLLEAKQIGSIIAESGKIYYSDMGAMSMVDNLYVYDENTKEITKLGEKGYVYDIERVITSGGGVSYGIIGGIKYVQDKLYSIGYEESGSDSSSLYSIDSKTKESKQLALGTSQFWIIDHQIYYIDTVSKKLMTIDLDGSNQETLINQGIAQVQYNGGSFYYTLLSDEGDLTEGFYRYEPSTGESITLSSKNIKEYFISGSSVYYTAKGYDAGLYKIQKGITTYLEKEPARLYLFDGEQMVFSGQYTKGIKIIK
jgi:hypothetical protein